MRDVDLTDAERDLLLGLSPVVRDMLAAADNGPGFLVYGDKGSTDYTAVFTHVSFKAAREHVQDMDSWAWLPASEASIMCVIVDDLGAPPVSLGFGFPMRGALEPPWWVRHGGQHGYEGDSVLGVLLAQLNSAAPTVRRPWSLPSLSTNRHVLVCGFDQGTGERLIVAYTLTDVQELWDKYAQGFAVQITWYEAAGEPFAVPLQAPAEC